MLALIAALATADAQEPVGVAVLASVPFVGSDHTLDPDGLVTVSPGFGVRGELSWGVPAVRGGIVLHVSDQLLAAPASWVPQYVEAGLSAQADIRLLPGAWELRLPIEGGVGLSSRVFPVPTLRAGAGLRVAQATGPVRFLAELRLLGALGASFEYNDLGAGGGTASGWQMAINVGVAFGGGGGRS